MRLKQVTGSNLWDKALSWGSSDNQEAAKPLFSRARPDSDKDNQNDESKSSFQVRKKFMKIIPKIISKGYLLKGEFLLFSTRHSSYDLMSLLINTETRQKRFLLRSVG
jgi:hypothetical protein